VRAALDQTDTPLRVDQSVAPGSVIPDVGDPLQSFIDIGSGGRVIDLRVQVAITHTYVGDLRVDLIAPDGSAVNLHDHQGGSSDNLRRTYSAANLPALRGLVDKPVEGRWTLRVVDDFRFDQGRLDSWRIVARVRND
jgi:subtilisin-like proprotein convertase family protein